MPSASGGGSVTVARISDASANGRSLISAADYTAMKTLLALTIGTNVQAYNAALTSLASASANGQSLVTAADYAAMRTLLGQGLVLLSTTTLAADATKTITPPFSSTYANYQIIANINGSAAADIRMQMDVSGTPAVTGYYSAGKRIDYLNAETGLGTTNATYWTLGQVIATSQSLFSFLITRPNVAASTHISGTPMTESTSTLYTSYWGGVLNDTVQYNAFKLLASTGTMTGTVWVYGMP